MEIKIKDLDDLEKFVRNENVSNRDKFTVFSKAVKDLPVVTFNIILGNEPGEIVEPEESPVPRMLEIIAEIRADPAKEVFGVLIYLSND